MNRRQQPIESMKIIETIGMFINSLGSPFTIGEIQSFVNCKIGISLKQQQIAEHLHKILKMSYRRVNSRLTILDIHNKLMLRSFFVVEFSNILSCEIMMVSID